MIRISSNVASLSAQAALGRTQAIVERATKEVATGSRFTNPGVDAAGLAIAENMRAHIKGFEAARYNSDNAVSFVQLAEGAINQQNNIVIRLRELAIQAASDTYSDRERTYLNNEFRQLVEEFDRIAKTTKFGSMPLLNGADREYEFHVGVNGEDEDVIRYASNTNTTAANMDIDGLSVEDKSDARESLETLDEALNNLNGSRAELGAIQSRMQMATENIDSQLESLTEAHSKMADADVASAVAKVKRGQIMMQYQAAMIANIQDQNQYMLRLIA